MAHPAKKSLGSNTLNPYPAKLLIGRGNIHCTQTSMPTLRRGIDREKDLVKSVSTWITNQRKEPRIPIELGRNPFLSITRKK
jgi:hypothetical protein